MSEENKKMTKIFWEIYYWLIILFIVFSFGALMFFTIYLPEEIPFSTEQNIFSSIYNILAMLLFIMLPVGLRGFIYNIKFFTRDIWRFIFFINIVDTIGSTIYEINTYGYFEYILMILILPLFYANYQYVFKMNNLWSDNND